MSFLHWLTGSLQSSRRHHSHGSARASRLTRRPILEQLEDRCLPSSVTVFTSDFNAGIPAEFSGVANSIEGVQGYSGLGPAGNTFSGDFLRNSSAGNPASATVLTLTDLPSHTGIDLNFLLAVIDSWDGNGTGDPNPSSSPDFLNVRVDAVTLFSRKLSNQSIAQQEYAPPPGVELAFRENLGFSTGTFWFDSAYNMGLDPTFDNIPHTASTLTIEWFASGAGWQGGSDESWAIDNVEVVLNGTTQLVAIDVKPGSDSNPINLASQGVVPVAMFGSATFDVTMVDIGSVLFAGATVAHSSWEDVNNDGYMDLVLHFRIQDTNLPDLYAQLLADADTNTDGTLDADVSTRQTATVSLTGALSSGDEFSGSDAVDLFLAGKALRDFLAELAGLGMI